VNQKAKTAKKVGVESQVHWFEENDCSTRTLKEQLIARIQELNNADRTHGIMVQLRLPLSVDKYKVLSTISLERTWMALLQPTLETVALPKQSRIVSRLYRQRNHGSLRSL
jgi:5,10-methylene-tetrahydrofolate dehydrogenase/methenyl tetrahydrofolate cyclohydrolase